MHPPVKGTRAEIPAPLWDMYLYWVTETGLCEDMRDMVEAEIREISRDATALTVGGKVVANRIVTKVENASWVKDFFRRVPRTVKP
jgi:hypothetical protein